MASIQLQIDQVATTMQTGMSEVLKGNDSIETTGQTFEEIVTTISQLEHNIEGIAESTHDLNSHTQESMSLFELMVDKNNGTVQSINVISETSRNQQYTIDSMNEAVHSLNEISREMQNLMKQLQS